MSDTEHFERFDWRKSLRFIERKLEEQESKAKDLEVLVVDDDPNDSLFLCNELAHFHCNVTVCHNPLEGVQLLAKKHFDLAFIDQKMPQLTGIELRANLETRCCACSEAV